MFFEIISIWLVNSISHSIQKIIKPNEKENEEMKDKEGSWWES